MWPLKLFLINIVLLLSAVLIDVHLLNDTLEKKYPTILGIWVISTLISIPIIIIWGIFKL